MTEKFEKQIKLWQSALSVVMTIHNANTSSFIDPNNDDNDAHRYWKLMMWWVTKPVGVIFLLYCQTH